VLSPPSLTQWQSWLVEEIDKPRQEGLMKQSVATVRLYQQTLEKSSQSVEDIGFKASPSS
jgi:hypothetical protein